MSDSSDEEVYLTPTELTETVKNAQMSFLPEQSREKYLKQFDMFNSWRLYKGAKTFSENVLLAYFIELSEKKKASTLWSIYSMLKATLKMKKDIHIDQYPKLVAFLKRASSGHQPKKSKVFKASEIEKFLNEAPDSVYLAAKVVLIIGINGACRTNELTQLKMENIEKHSNDLLLINLPKTKTKIDRNFVIRKEYVTIIEKYQALRPPNTPIDRFFLQYRNGKSSKLIDLIVRHTRVSTRHLTPELRMRVFTPACDVWGAREGEGPFVDPYWGFYWPGGQAVARYILDNGDKIRNCSVLDVGCGCGAGAIAAAKVNARRVLANDIDPYAIAATEINAQLNDVVIETSTDNVIGTRCDDFDTILIGDMFYDEEFAKILFDWLNGLVRQEKMVLIGDPGRHGLTDKRRKQISLLATYKMLEESCEENHGFTDTTVWQLSYTGK